MRDLKKTIPIGIKIVNKDTCSRDCILCGVQENDQDDVFCHLANTILKVERGNIKRAVKCKELFRDVEILKKSRKPVNDEHHKGLSIMSKQGFDVASRFLKSLNAWGREYRSYVEDMRPLCSMDNMLGTPVCFKAFLMQKGNEEILDAIINFNEQGNMEIK